MEKTLNLLPRYKVQKCFWASEISNSVKSFSIFVLFWQVQRTRNIQFGLVISILLCQYIGDRWLKYKNKKITNKTIESNRTALSWFESKRIDGLLCFLARIFLQVQCRRAVRLLSIHYSLSHSLYLSFSLSTWLFNKGKCQPTELNELFCIWRPAYTQTDTDGLGRVDLIAISVTCRVRH